MSKKLTDQDNTGIPDDPLTGHQYDGIEEFDNPLPGWWKWIFVLCILFSIPYTLFYHGGAEGRSIEEGYEVALADNLRLQFAEIGELKADRANVIKFLYKPNMLSIGKAVFKSNCTSCHGSDGGGLVGPNLTDEEYKNVKDIGDFINVLENGAGAGAMPAWKNRLSTNEIVMVSSYVASLRGTVPASAKAPQGNKIAPWPPAPAEESEEEAEESEEEPEEAATGDDTNEEVSSDEPETPEL
ncbi:Cbb3-type cytochrome c oxidase subunit CcoP2 [Rubripirellula amarantea]|uniref:Cbb3-type cytochrome c oxidase subunit CcoP2 n=1 Tax=Rubripirellula amarantea TaxID=2527999 RepID=A0A5C5WKT7_9BACT|nr:cbb3-type cytochrome c oxidase N-terminal domain-containing protein [Rubripirellula amarantea]TWT51237.1 Cbb3-type cytochrome c oxidase subunit CcoP2 [Rubripirellula amarantea]